MFESFYAIICGNVFLKDIQLSKLQTVCFDDSILKCETDLKKLISHMQLEFKIKTSKKSYICAPNLIHKLERKNIEKLIKKIPSLRTKYYPLPFFYVNFYKKNIKRVLKPQLNTDIITDSEFFPSNSYIKQKDYVYLTKEVSKDNFYFKMRFNDFE